MDGFLPGKGLKDIFAEERHNRRGNFADIDQNGIKRVKSQRIAFPEAVACAADVPVIQHFHKSGNLIGSYGNIIRFNTGFDRITQALQF